MYSEGRIIYFTPFYFSENKTRTKYFVVLKNIENSYLLASLPTKVDHIPIGEEIERGCIELPTSSFNCFFIPKTEIVTTCGKQFELNTHLYGEEIIEKSIEELRRKYVIEGVHYQIWGQMKTELFNELIHCFKNSRRVDRKYKRLL